MIIDYSCLNLKLFYFLSLPFYTACVYYFKSGIIVSLKKNGFILYVVWLSALKKEHITNTFDYNLGLILWKFSTQMIFNVKKLIPYWKILSNNSTAPNTFQKQRRRIEKFMVTCPKVLNWRFPSIEPWERLNYIGQKSMVLEKIKSRTSMCFRYAFRRGHSDHNMHWKKMLRVSFYTSLLEIVSRLFSSILSVFIVFLIAIAFTCGEMSRCKAYLVPEISL